jgi:RND family efflux transporter MFP subunit
MNRRLVILAILPLTVVLFGATLVGCRGARTAGAEAPSDSADKPAAKDKGDEKGAEGASKEADTGEAELPTVSAAVARVGTIEKTLPVSGTLAAPRERVAMLSSPVAGILDALPVQFGQEVAQGQVVAHISTHTLQGLIEQERATIGQDTVQVQQAEAGTLQQQGQSRSALLEAQTAVSSAQATLLGDQATLAGNEAALNNARQSLARTQALFADGLVAKKDIETAELAVRSAEAQVAAQRQAVASQRQTVTGLQEAVEAARASRIQDTIKQKDIQIARQQLENARGALATTEAQLSLYTLRAPLSGTVTAVNVSVGEAVDTTTKILTIADQSRLRLQIAVPTASAGVVHVGQPVTFSVDALPGHTFRTIIQNVGTQVDPTNSTILAVADVANPHLILKDGMAARVGIVTARHANVILAPRAAVLYDAGEGSEAASVLRVDKNGVVHKVPVTVGFSGEADVEITSGIRPGDRLVTTGAFGLPDGAKVKIEGEGGDAADKAATKEKGKE